METPFKLNYKRDILYTIIFIIILSFILIQIDAFEHLTKYSLEHEDYELDEIFLVILTLPLALSWFTFRRLKDISIINKNLKKEIEIGLEQNKIIESQSKNALLGEMIGSIAHQWRQPLSAITMISSGLKLELEYDLFEKKELSKKLDTIMNNSNYLSKTIDIFRDFNKKDKMNNKKNIKETLSSALDIVESSISNSFIKIERNFKNIEKLELNTVHSELQHVIINLINNSKDAIISNKKNGKITIESNIKNDSIVEIKIIDNGGGIDKKILPRIFEPYFTTKHQSQGTGLGLYIVYKIVTEKLEGEINIENSKDGTVATLLIPNLENK